MFSTLSGLVGALHFIAV